MKIYKAYLNQNNEGCDYTIGCGKTVIDIKASSMEEAKKKLAEKIVEENSDDETLLQSAEIYEIEQVFRMDVISIYQEAKRLRDEERDRETSEKEKKEFERLKAKFGN